MFRHEYAPARRDQEATKSADFVQPGNLENIQPDNVEYADGMFDAHESDLLADTPSWANQGLEVGNESQAKKPHNPRLPAELRDFVPLYDDEPSPAPRGTTEALSGEARGISPFADSLRAGSHRLASFFEQRALNKDFREATRENKAFDKQADAEKTAAAAEDPIETKRKEDEAIAGLKDYKRFEGMEQGIRNDQRAAERKQAAADRKQAALDRIDSLKTKGLDYIAKQKAAMAEQDLLAAEQREVNRQKVIAFAKRLGGSALTAATNGKNAYRENLKQSKEAQAELARKRQAAKDAKRKSYTLLPKRDALNIKI